MDGGREGGRDLNAALAMVSSSDLEKVFFVSVFVRSASTSFANSCFFL